jgi:hypothetical protein
MRNFFQQGPPPMRANHQFYGRGPVRGPGRMPNYGFPPTHPNRFHPGMIPPGGQKGTSKIESFMETCNQLLATAQGFQPYIAQATPLIRNIPALWRLYKGFSSGSKGKEKEKEEIESSEFNLESSDFEYEYKEDVKESKHEQNQGGDHHQEKPNRPKHKYDYSEGNRHTRGRTSNSAVRHEKRNDKQENVVKLAAPLKTKPSRPKIFQPTFDFEE